MRRPKGRRSALLLVAACALIAAGCKDEYSDEPFGVLDLAPTFNGTSVVDPTAGVTPTIPPTFGFVDGTRAEYYDFGTIPTKRDLVTNVPLSVPVQPMYFFFSQPEGYPLFSTSVREARDGTDWMRGGKGVLNPNPKDFCGTIPMDQRAGMACDRQNRDEKKKPYPIRLRELFVDANRHNADYQRPIIDVTPADKEAYSGLWEIIEVTAPHGYDPDAIKHLATLDRAVAAKQLGRRATGKVINCPIVDERTIVSRGISDPTTPHPRIELWYRRQMAFCYLANGWETLANDAGQLLFSDSDDQRVDTFDVSTLLLGDGANQESRRVVPIVRAYVPVIFGADQGDGTQAISPVLDNLITRSVPRHFRNDPPGYSPIRWIWNYVVPLDYEVGRLTSVDALDPDNSFPEGGQAQIFTPTVKNLPLRGLQIPCSYPRDTTKTPNQCGRLVPDPDMPGNPNATIIDAREDPTCTKLGLECNKDTCFCEAPFVGYGQACGPGIAQCSPDKDAFSEFGYTCFPPSGGFCYLGCNPGLANTHATENQDQDPTKFLDSRCKDLVGFECLISGGGPLCVKFCDQNVTMGDQCATSAVVDKDPQNIGAGQTCQDFGLEVCAWPDGYTPSN